MDKYTFDEIQNKILIRLSNDNDKDIFFSMELIRDIF